MWSYSFISTGIGNQKQRGHKFRLPFPEKQCMVQFSEAMQPCKSPVFLDFADITLNEWLVHVCI